jgi:flagellar hook-associated protein 1 FlgK
MRRIADLNRNILASGGAIAVDLQDSRDNAIDALSELMTVHVVSHDDGTVSLIGEGANLVDRVTPARLSVTGSGSNVAVVDAGGTMLGAVGGSMGGALDLIDRKLPAIRAQLDLLAGSLVSEVNAVHRTGYTATGATNTDFFDPTRLTAGAIKLTDALLNSSGAVAAGGSNLAGDGSVALQLAQLGSSPIGLLGARSFRDFFSSVAAGVGLAVQGASADSDVQQSLMDQADQRRTAVSGVSIDEEMVNLMSQQQAYGAAAKIVTAADEMIQVLLDSI